MCTAVSCLWDLPGTQITGILYTLPSVAVFFLLLPITGRGTGTALIALVAYTLLIIFRNVITGLEGVPEEARDAGSGMGLTARQLLWRVELPLALPEIMAGLRIAVTTTVGLASLAFLAGAGGLGDTIFSDRFFRSNVLVAGGLCVLMAQPYGMTVIDDVIWYVESNTRPNNMVRFDPKTEKFQTFLIPEGGGGIVRHMMPTKDGNIAMAMSGLSAVGIAEILPATGN